MSQFSGKTVAVRHGLLLQQLHGKTSPQLPMQCINAHITN